MYYINEYNLKNIKDIPVKKIIFNDEKFNFPILFVTEVNEKLYLVDLMAYGFFEDYIYYMYEITNEDFNNIEKDRSKQSLFKLYNTFDEVHCFHVCESSGTVLKYYTRDKESMNNLLKYNTKN